MPAVLIDIEARFAKALDGLDRVAKAGEQTGRRLDAAFSTAKAGIAGLVGALSVDALVGKFKSVVDSMDALNDASDKTGASVEDLSSLLNTLKPYGASLENITTATGQLAKAMDAAGDSGSKQAEAFKALGISTKDAHGNLRGTTDVLGDIARAFDGYADGTNKTVLAQVLLGKSGAELLPMLKDLAGAEKQSASVTSEAAAQAEKFNVELARLALESEKLWQSLASKLVPQITNMIEQFNKGKEAAGGFWAALGRYGLSMPGDPSAKISETLQKLQGLEKDLARQDNPESGGFFGRGARTAAENRKKQIQADIDQARKDLEYYQLLFRQQMGDSKNPFDPERAKPSAPGVGGGNTDAAAKRLTDGERYLRNLQDQISRTSELTEVEKLLADIQAGRIKFDTEQQNKAAMAAARVLDINKQEAEITKAVAREKDEAARAENEEMDRFVRSAEQRNEQMERLAQQYGDLADPAAKYRRQLEEINELQRRGDLKAGIADLASIQVMKQMNAALDDGTDKLEKQIDLAKDFGVTMKSAFEDAIFSGKRLGDILNSLIQDFLKLVLRKNVTEPLFGSLMSAAGSLFGDGSAAARTTDLQNMAGAELTELSKMSGGATIVQYITNQGGASPAEMAQFGENIKNATLKAVAERERR